MKLIAIGDIHGKNIWKKILDKEKNADKVVFIGDYFDCWEPIPSYKQLENFNEIIQLKIDNPDKYIILLGNHDMQYTPGFTEHYSGYQIGGSVSFGIKLGEVMSLNLVQMCYKHNNYLFSHAGVTKTWAKNHNIDVNDIEQSINYLFKYKPVTPWLFQGRDYYGDNVTQSPIWVRPESLYNDGIGGFIQVVGHTHMMDNIMLGGKNIFIDILDDQDKYLIIENNMPKEGIL